MRVLITRPEADAHDLKASIEALGWQTMLAPLLTIELLPIASDALDGVTALIATSRNGLRALAASDAALAAARGKPIFTVGPATTDMAQSLGFTQITEGPGTGEELAAVIAGANLGVNDRLLHLAADHIAFDLEAALATHGIAVKKLVAYRSVAADTLPDEVNAALIAGTLDAVVLMSPRAARTWRHCTSALTPHADLTKPTYICLSENVANALGPSFSKVTRVAEAPNFKHLCALLYRLADEAKTR